jgi:hypothetical protein
VRSADIVAEKLRVRNYLPVVTLLFKSILVDSVHCQHVVNGRAHPSYYCLIGICEHCNSLYLGLIFKVFFSSSGECRADAPHNVMNQHAHQSSRLLGHQTPDGRLSEQTPQDNRTGQRRGTASWASSGPVAGRTPTDADEDRRCDHIWSSE